MNGKRLVEISRPVGWLAAPLMMLVAVFNFGTPQLTSLFYLELVLYTGPFCLFLYGINDIYDRDTDRENDRKEEGSAFLDGRFLDEDIDGFLKRHGIILSTILLAIPVLRQNLMHLAGVSVLLFFSYGYSAPPLRLKARAPLDSLSCVAIYFFGPFLIGLSYTTASVPQSFSLWMGSVTFAVHAFSTIMDYEPDKKAGIDTFAVRFGRTSAAVLCTTIYAVLTLVPSVTDKLRFASIGLGLVTAPMIKDDFRDEHAADGFRAYTLILIVTAIAVTVDNLQLV